jgi:putative endonuclease
MSPLSSHKQSLGKYGETLAASYLKGKGYQVIQQNFKARYGELDIIAIDHSTLVFVEVKTRIGNRFGAPEEAVTPKKIRELIKTGEYYGLLHPNLPKQLRIDVIAIKLTGERLVESISQIKNITG